MLSGIHVDMGFNQIVVHGHISCKLVGVTPLPEIPLCTFYIDVSSVQANSICWIEIRIEFFDSSFDITQTTPIESSLEIIVMYLQ